MAYNEELETRLAAALHARNINFEQKRMFGGVCFMINEKMCLGVSNDFLMLRALNEHYEQLLHEPHIEPMIFGKKILHGFLFLEEGAWRKEKDLQRWIGLGLEFAEKGVVKSKSTSKKTATTTSVPASLKNKKAVGKKPTIK